MPESERRWTVIVGRQPKRTLRRLPRDLLQRIRETIGNLADDPRPPGCKKLAGYENLYRVRVGDWRISYAVEDDRLLVVVVEAAPRGAAYQW
jgi:mRNA interferase RelE/StbE